jgi:hypothetical protein
MRTTIVALILLAGIAPVAAAPNCLLRGSGTYALDDEGNPSELAQLEIDEMRLRGAGYRPMWVERWAGCIKVTYRDEDGRLVTEYLDPISLEPAS